MAYMALYRKWRPNDFDEVQGQDAIVQTLRNEIIYDRIGHAYLFCGTRGTGKTSIAKLFAKAVNCQHPVDGNPCNQCPSCQAINNQSSLDVLEIDAASNNGVDHIREIREQVQYSPVEGKYKVYIIDEVHMLSSGAFNALLKTLEEPPSYVIFILATTEKYKIPVTILSRCQKYDFKRISIDTITNHLVHLMEKEGIPAEEKALRYIARAADGSMRDALSLLDQCIAFYLNQTLTYDNVLEVLGTVDTAVFSQLLRNILAQDTIAVLHTVDQMITEGRELSQFLADFLWYLRNLLIIKDQNGMEDTLDLSTESIAALQEEASLIETSTLLRFIRVLSDLSGQLRNATQKRILLEVGFIRLCTPQMETDSGSLLERVHMLEKKMAEGIPVQAAGPGGYGAAGIPGTGGMGTAFGPGGSAGLGDGTPGGPGGSSAVASENAAAALEERFSPAEAADLKAIASSWNTIVGQTAMPMQKFLQAARIAVSEDSSIIQLIFERDDIEKNYFERNHQHNLGILSDIVAEQTGKRVKFECSVRSHDTGGHPSNFIDLSKIHQQVIFE
ncbi:DNA polymerase III subunit gamma/tau [Eubacterium sp. An11]|uniref:DNA polymerase III subunit gamma/tau n=1 Tax=Eubacterium sp. An11 TaxID=1965542 RepID=UPI000B38D720|nr:DNA polymerase III subunit gamma/tau [Eubacterium sp. An11]OUQ68587.1 DNA polymerase III subunit gamma/tau [Eubacterium sp. An11]